VAAGEEAGLAAAGCIKIDEIPYDFERRRLTIVFSEDQTEGHLMVTKGAFAEVLDICTTVATGSGEVPLDNAHRDELEAIFRARSADGLRVLALATRRFAPRADYDRADEAGMTFRGFLMFNDPPKEDAAATIAALRNLGIAIKVISGDNRHVTAHVARAVGLDAHAMLTGEEIRGMRDEALWHLAPRTDLFVEIDPQQKERIVRALQRTGEAVGFLGDGINDAPALHAADVGVSVAGAVDVARESADLVLTHRDLDVLRAGVEGGRRTFANTLKYISITTSANFGNMISMAIVTPFLPFLPLLPKQILLNNFLSDLPALAIAVDRVDPEQLATPQRWNVGDIRRFMIVFGLVSSIFDLLTFGLLIWVFQAGAALFQTSWFMISLLTELAVLLVLRTRRSAFRSRPGAILLWATGAVLALTFAIPWLGPLSAAFGFVPVPASVLVAIAAILLGYIVATEAVKVWFFRRHADLATGAEREAGTCIMTAYHRAIVERTSIGSCGIDPDQRCYDGCRLFSNCYQPRDPAMPAPLASTPLAEVADLPVPPPVPRDPFAGRHRLPRRPGDVRNDRPGNAGSARQRHRRHLAAGTGGNLRRLVAAPRHQPRQAAPPCREGAAQGPALPRQRARDHRRRAPGALHRAPAAGPPLRRRSLARAALQPDLAGVPASAAVVAQRRDRDSGGCRGTASAPSPSPSGRCSTHSRRRTSCSPIPRRWRAPPRRAAGTSCGAHSSYARISSRSCAGCR
jgi:phosphoserine phosphatase